MPVKKPLLSIIVPVYNVENYLRKCLDSLVSQTLEDLEIIVVNDCSPDRSQEIIDEYVRKDTRVKSVIHEKNGGAGVAKNTGIEAAKGEYITFVDSDDWVDLTTYQYLCERIVKEKVDILAFGFNYYQQEKTTVCINPSLHLQEKKIIQAYLKNHIFTTPWSKIYARELFNNPKNRFPTYRMYDDFVFAFQILCEARSFIQIELPFYNYYDRSNSVMNSVSVESIKTFASCLEDLKIIFKAYQLEIFQREFENYLQQAAKYYYVDVLLKNADRVDTSQMIRTIEKYIEFFGILGISAIYEYGVVLKKQNLLQEQRLALLQSNFLSFYYYALDRYKAFSKEHGHIKALKKTVKKIIQKIK